MSRRRRGAESTSAATARAASSVTPAIDPSPRPAPPVKHPWQLGVSCALMLAWLLLLAWMAWGS